jgi:hypothetical protein
MDFESKVRFSSEILVHLSQAICMPSASEFPPYSFAFRGKKAWGLAL